MREMETGRRWQAARRVAVLAGAVGAGLLALMWLIVPPIAHAAPGPLIEVHRQGATPLQDLVTRELATAQAARQSVVIMFTADWCSPCKAIKDWVHESKAVQKAAAKGRILLVDVDEWRGPAQSLLPGIDAQKLPQLARLDAEGKVVVSCYGTDLGIMEEGAMAKNLARLIAGKAPEKPEYEKSPDKTRELAIADMERQKAKTTGQPEVEVGVVDMQQAGSLARWTLHVVLRNHDSRRRWYVMTGRVGEALSEAPKVDGWVVWKLDEHVRATYLQMKGAPAMTIFPVAGWGSVDLGRWVVEGAAGASTFEVWELGQLMLDGQQAQFDKKVPFELVVRDGSKARAVFTRSTPAPVTLRVEEKHSVGLELPDGR